MPILFINKSIFFKLKHHVFLGQCYTLGNFHFGHSGDELNDFSTIEMEPLTDEDCETRDTFLTGYPRSHYRNYVCSNFRAEALVSRNLIQ